ncbi:HEAT repeat domain-containing protein [Alienimonas sp. DA493]|uniref:HEAT repeat domain-containing protein n=1 Tax=Alienimonas sp. DA493 TaxID=3373605 RepID=UPI00375514D7
MFRRPAVLRLVPLLCLPGLAGCFSQGYGVGYVAGKLVTGQPIGDAVEADAAAGNLASSPLDFTPPSVPTPTFSPPSRPERPAMPGLSQEPFDRSREMAENSRQRAEDARRDALERTTPFGGPGGPFGDPGGRDGGPTSRPRMDRFPRGPGLRNGPDGGPIAGAAPFGDAASGTPDAPPAEPGMAAAAPPSAANASPPRSPTLREPAAGESELDWAVRVLNVATDSDWVARKRAVEALEALDPAAATPDQREAVIAALSARLEDAVKEGGFAVDRAAKTLLVWADEPEQFSAIGEALLAGTGLGRKGTLAELDPQNPVHARVAVPLLTHDWEGDEALAFIRKMGAPAEPAVLTLLDDPNPATRRDVASLLAELGGEASAEALKERAAKETDRALARHMRVQRAAILNK